MKQIKIPFTRANFNELNQNFSRLSLDLAEANRMIDAANAALELDKKTMASMRDRFAQETELVRKRHQAEIDALNSRINMVTEQNNSYRNQLLYLEAWQKATQDALNAALKPDRSKFNV